MEFVLAHDFGEDLTILIITLTARCTAVGSAFAVYCILGSAVQGAALWKKMEQHFARPLHTTIYLTCTYFKSEVCAML